MTMVLLGLWLVSASESRHLSRRRIPAARPRWIRAAGLAGRHWASPTVAADGPASRRLYCSDFLSAGQGVAVGADGAEAVTTDGGAHWTVVAPYGLVPWSLNDVQARTWQDVWAVGGLDARFPNTVLHTVDGGATWDQVGVGAGNSLEAVDFIDAGHGWILGRDGVALHTEDGGQSWQARGCSTGSTTCARQGREDGGCGTRATGKRYVVSVRLSRTLARGRYTYAV